jgi:Coenzyme PQQ synthesis protein D (PqqD)
LNPNARRDHLVIQEVGDELVVYDQKRHRAHHLNPAAALIWRSCDGHSSVADLAAMLQQELNVPANEDLVWRGLDRLGRAQLLRERLTPPAGAKISRRQALGQLGKAAAVAVLVPAVLTIVAPAPVQAGICDMNPCRRHCIDICRTGRDCHDGERCRIFTCGFPGCDSCTQKKCLHISTPTHRGL